MCICIVAALRQCKYMKYNGRWAQEQSLIFLASVPKCVQAGVSPLLFAVPFDGIVVIFG